MAKDRFKYAYDRTSNRTSRDPAADSHTPPDANDNYYTYDGLDRLVKSNWGTLDGSGVITDQNADANQAWGLDTVGNWSQFKWDTDGGGAGTPITQTRAHNTANEIAGNGGNPISGTGAANWVDPTYDPAGNMTAGPQPRYETADANTQLYVYDAWNRLTKIYEDANCNDMIDDPGELVATYSYDGQNRRIRKVLAVPNPDVTYDYYYNESWQVLEVRKGGDTDPLEQYVWGIQYVDAPVVRFRDGNVDGDLLDTQDNTDSTLYYTYDGNFNVTAVVKPDGTVAERYTYDPYGQVTFKAADWSDAASQAKSAYDNEILYCGYRFDPESGNYIVRRRYLTPPLGRWLTTDPIEYGDGMNWYQFAHCSPAQYLDPDGYSAVSVTELEVWFTEVTPGAAGQAHWAFKVNAAACECDCNHRWYIPQYDLEIVLFVTLNPGKNDPPDRIGKYSRQGVYGHEMRHIRMMERALYERESELVKLLQDEELKGRGRFVSEEQCNVIRKRNQELIDAIRGKMLQIQFNGTSEVEPGFKDVATDDEAERTGHPRASTEYDRRNDDNVNYSAITPDKYDPDKWSVSFGKPVPVKAPEWTLSERYDKDKF